MAQWIARLTHNVEVMGSSPINAPIVSLSKKLYPYCLVLVGSRNRFERDLDNICMTLQLNSLLLCIITGTEQKSAARELWTSPSGQSFLKGTTLRLKCIFAGK